MLGNRRIIGAAIIAMCMGAVLTGCSAGATSVTPDSAAVALGAQAIGAASAGGSTSGGSNGSAGWTSAVPCPAALRASLQADLPAGSTVTTLDPKTVTGPLGDPQLTAADVATCAFSLTTPNSTLDELYFIGMDDADAAVITHDLQADNFVAGAVTTNSAGTLQTFTNASARIAVEKLTESGQPVVVVGG